MTESTQRLPLAGPGPPASGLPPGLAEKVAALGRPGAYEEPVTGVIAIETHMSWVFLTDRHAYKMKKPVRHAFLDFSTLALRKADCDEEIRLNRRLAPDVYLGVVPVAQDREGTLRVAGGGTIVEWLVQMVRLPRERMLDVAMVQGAVTVADVARLARVLAAFYRRCATDGTPADAYLARLRDEVQRCRQELSTAQADYDGGAVEAAAGRMLAFLERRRALLDARVADQRIVDGHGDLRPEHVCLLDPPVVIDCLEFNRALRVADSADERCHLQMECTRLGFEDTGGAIAQAVADELGDPVPAPLAAFYRAYRAFTRARLAAWHSVDAPAADPQKWTRRAREYLMLAERYAREC